MTAPFLLNELQKVFRKVFSNSGLEIKENTTAGDIPGWDSLTHMRLIVEIENFFKITFTFDEVSEFNTVGDMVNCILVKVK